MSHDGVERYSLSFTTGGLLTREAVVLAPIYMAEPDWGKVRERAVKENRLQARTHSSAVTLVRKTIERVSALSDLEIPMLLEVTASEREHLMWAAACRRFKLIGEFAEEVLHERFLTLAGTLSYEDYDSFYRSKAIWHDELDRITDLTYRKLRQVLFRMMSEAGFLTKQGVIEPVLLSARIAESLSEHSPRDIRFFPTRESY